MWIAGVFSAWMCSSTGWAVPSSTRSQNAITRHQNQLTEDLDAQGLRWGAPIYIRIFKEESELELWVQGENGLNDSGPIDLCLVG